MDFGEKIKGLRLEQNLTQEQMAEKLNVTRQAVSNWENNRNLPDIELLLTISKVFNLSLNKLILGDDYFNNMTKKIIDDASEGRRAKRNMISIIIGALLLIIGLGCILIKATSVEYIDAQGFLHENFFLLPIGFFFIFSGLITFVVTGIKDIYRKLKKV